MDMDMGTSTLMGMVIVMVMGTLITTTAMDTAMGMVAAGGMVTGMAGADPVGRGVHR
jgi:hypothetical protein